MSRLISTGIINGVKRQGYVDANGVRYTRFDDLRDGSFRWRAYYGE